MAVAELVVNIVAKTSGFSKGIKNASTDLKKLSKNVTSLGRTVSRVSIPLALLGGLAIKTFSDFDSAMTKSLSIMGEVSEAMRKDMVKAAIELSKKTTFSAKQIADSFFFLASAGLDAKESLEALPAVAQFAQAGAFDLATATDLLTDAQSALGLETKDLVKVSDVLVKANTLANASVEQFSESLTQKAGAALKSTNKSLEEGAAALSVFANAGLKGEAAGVALNTVLVQLPVLANKNAEAFEKAGIAVFDANGKFKNLADIIGDYEKATENLTDAQRAQLEVQLGFNRNTLTSMRLLGGSSEQLREFQKELENAGGITEEVANKQLKSFAAQMTILKNNVDAAQIVIGQALAPAVLKLGEIIKSITDAFSKLDPQTQKAIAAFGAIVAIAGPLLIGLGLIIGALGTLTGVLAAAAGALAFLLSPIGLIIVAIGLVVAAIIVFREEINAWIKNVEAATQRFRDAFKERFAEALKIVQEFIAAIKTELITKFNKIVTDFGKGVDAITGFFADMFDKVVGNSFVPDMIQRIKDEFDKLTANMVKPAEVATDQTAESFDMLASQVTSSVQEISAETTLLNTIFEGLGAKVNESLSGIVGNLGGFGDTVTGLISQISDAINSSGGGGGSGGLGGLFSSIAGGGISMDSLGGSLFGSARPEGVSGPLLPSGDFTPGAISGDPGGGMFAGAASSSAFAAAAPAILAGIALIGKDTVSTFEGIGGAAGAGFGAAFGGPVGAQIGGTIGPIIGKAVGKGIKHMFGGEHFETTARKEFKKFMDGMLEQTDIQIFDAEGQLQPFKEFNLAAKGVWKEADWAGTFEEAAGAAYGAFSGVGLALAKLSGLADVHGGQIAKMLFDNVGGSVENLGRLIGGLKIPIQDFEAVMLESLEKGEISIREYVIAMNGIREGFAQAEIAANDVAVAVERLVELSGDTMQSVDAIKTLAAAAKKEGIASIDALVDRMVQSGKISVEKAKVFLDAMKAFGIQSIDQLEAATTDTIASILTTITSVALDGGEAFFDLSNSATEAFEEIEKSAKGAANQIENSLGNINVDANVNVSPTQNAKGNIFTNGSIKQFAKGGVVSDFTLFDIGSMAERGPEAILPLERLSNGDLGVRSANSSGGDVTVRIDARGAELGVEKRIKREIETYFDRKNREPGRRI